jgi:hypothetical protein
VDNQRTDSLRAGRHLASSVSRRSVLKLGGWLAAVAALLGAWTPRASASGSRAQGQVLEGSWILDILVAAGQRRTTLLTFTPEGGVVTTGSDHPTRSPGFGAWMRTGDRQFVATWRQLLFDANGAYVGQLKNRLRMQLNETLNELDVQGQPETFDLEGNLLTSGRTVTKGVRIVAEEPD